MLKIPANIDPRIFSQFEGLQVTHAQALAEFIDNSIQSFKENESQLLYNTPGYKFRVDINFEWGETKEGNTNVKRIIIRDNAAGLNSEMLTTAFITGRPREPRQENSLNEFGMGMKTMACWLSNKLTMNTHSFTENVERTVVFDKKKLISNPNTFLDVTENIAPRKDSWTEIILDDLVPKNVFNRRNVNKLRATLGSIYRNFIRRNYQIYVDGELLTFTEINVLNAPYYKTPDADSEEWRIQIDKTFFKTKRIRGFIALKNDQVASTSRFILSRRGRVVVGENAESHYYIKSLCGQAGSPQDKRVFGEFELDGFSSTFNKNGIAEDDDLQLIFNSLAKDEQIKRLLRQGYEYRQNEKVPDQTFVNVYTSCTPSTGGFVTGSGKFLKGSAVKLVASPKSGFKFVKWDDGDTNPIRIISVTKSVKFQATFLKVDNKPEGDTSGAGGDTTGTNDTTGKDSTPPPPSTQFTDGAIFFQTSIKTGNTLFDLYVRISHKQNYLLSEPNVVGKNITIRFNNLKCGLHNPNDISDDVKTVLQRMIVSLCKSYVTTGKVIDFIDNINDMSV